MRGFPDYHIKSIQPDGTRARAPDRDEHFPIFYAATEAFDSPVYGLDLNDGDLRQRALDAARDDDRPAASSHFALRGNRVGFLMVCSGIPAGCASSDGAGTPGTSDWVCSGLLRDQRPAREHHQHHYRRARSRCLLFSTRGRRYCPLRRRFTSTAPASRWFRSARKRSVPLLPVSARRRGFPVGDAQWTMVAVPIAGGPVAPSYVRAWIVLICGILLTGAIAAYIWRTGKHAERLRTSNQELDLTLGMLSDPEPSVSIPLSTTSCRASSCSMLPSASSSATIVSSRCTSYRPSLLSRAVRFATCYCSRAASGLFRADPEEFRNQLLPQLGEGNILTGRRHNDRRTRHICYQ